MLDQFRTPPVAKAARKALHQIDDAIGLTQKQCAGIRGDGSPAKSPTTARPLTGAKSNSAALHSVRIGEFLRPEQIVVAKQFSQNPSPDALTQCEKCGLGFKIAARPDRGFVHYVPACLDASKDILKKFMRADETTLVDIVLRRVVREGVFRFTDKLDPELFTDQPPGEPIV